jgi:asparagine N-glycosylation enzyme membrane subunit Stt3
MRRLLAVALLFALVTRVVIPWHNVFQSTGIVLTTPDAYIMLRYADMWPNFPAWDWYSNYPVGVAAFQSTIFPSLIAIFGRLFHSNLMAAAILPVLLFFLTLIPLYVIARVVFDRNVAVGALIIYCLLPGELLERTKLGAADYHCWEIFLFTSIMMCVMLAVNGKYVTRCWLFTALVVFGLAIYALSWQGWLILPFILVLSAGLFAFLRLKGWPWKVGTVFCYAAGLGMIALAFPAIFRYAVGLFSINLSTTTNEMMSLFFTAGQFDTWATVWNYFGAVFFFTLFGLGWLAYRAIKYKRFLDILFLAWSIIMLWLTIAMRRFDYYFAANAAILASFVIWQYGQHWAINKDRIVKYAVVIGLIVIAPLVSISARAANDNSYMPSPGWQHVCQWFADQSNTTQYIHGAKPDYGVFTVWSYGYWLQGIGHQAVDGTGGNWPPRETALLSSDNLTDALIQLKKLDMRYIVIDEAIVKGRMEQTFVHQLYYSQGKPVFQSGNVKVFEIQ